MAEIAKALEHIARSLLFLNDVVANETVVGVVQLIATHILPLMKTHAPHLVGCWIEVLKLGCTLGSSAGKASRQRVSSVCLKAMFSLCDGMFLKSLEAQSHLVLPHSIVGILIGSAR